MKNAISCCVIQCLALNGARLLPSPISYKVTACARGCRNTKATAMGSIPGSGLLGIFRTQVKRVDEPF
jgi:hypothetical protein